MKKLYLIRHAKSSWKDISLNDFDRPLNKRGKRNAPFMALKLKEKNIYPDLLLSSPANRAKTTAKYFKEKYDFKEKIVLDDSLYHASNAEMEAIVKNIDDKYNTVFLFAHNPTINTFVENYVDIYDNVPTCGIVGIEFDTDRWSDFTFSVAELVMFDFPKNYLNSEDEV
jgi:phosphohistidine phosphatase